MPPSNISRLGELPACTPLSLSMHCSRARESVVLSFYVCIRACQSTFSELGLDTVDSSGISLQKKLQQVILDCDVLL